MAHIISVNMAAVTFTSKKNAAGAALWFHPYSKKFAPSERPCCMAGLQAIF
jgi:hypothetical protein